MEFLKKLSKGSFGLYQTFWLYGVGVNIAVTLVLKFMPEGDNAAPTIAICGLHTIYKVFWTMGIWNASLDLIQIRGGRGYGYFARAWLLFVWASELKQWLLFMGIDIQS